MSWRRWLARATPSTPGLVPGRVRTGGLVARAGARGLPARLGPRRRYGRGPREPRPPAASARRARPGRAPLSGGGEARPGRSTPHFNLGVLLEESGRRDEAVRIPAGRAAGAPTSPTPTAIWDCCWSRSAAGRKPSAPDGSPPAQRRGGVGPSGDRARAGTFCGVTAGTCDLVLNSHRNSVTDELVRRRPSRSGRSG